MEQHDRVTDYLSRVMQRLQADGFTITDNVTFGNQTFKCVAKRTRFQLEYFGFAEFFFILAEFSSLDRTSLREFSAKCFKYAKKYRSIPLPCGLYERVICFPVAMVDGIDTPTAEAVRDENPPKHWVNYNVPVICDLGARQLHYSEKNPLRGRMYHDHFREIIRNMLSP